jgi:hypothetical protein
VASCIACYLARHAADAPLCLDSSHASLESRLAAAFAATRTSIEALEKMTAERDEWKKTAQDKAGAASSTVENLRAARDRETERANRAEGERDEALARAAAMRAVIMKERHEPQNVPEQIMESGYVVESSGNEWVCVHCGGRGEASPEAVAHEAECFYVEDGAALAPDAGRALLDRLKAAEDRATRLYEAACNHEISEKRKDDAVNGELARLRAQLAAAESRARGLEEQLEAADDIVDKARWILDDSYKTEDDQARVLDAGLCVQLGELIDGYDRTVVPVLAASPSPERGSG